MEHYVAFILDCSFFCFLIVCAEAYNPDEEEDDMESRVFNLLKDLLLSSQTSEIIKI